MAAKKTDSYTAKESLKHLTDAEAVRAVPGMYIGSTSERGLLHMAEEIWANSVDEHLAGHGEKIIVEIDADGWCTVTDFGRGIPVDIHPETGLPGVEMVLTKLHGGGKFRDGASGYAISGGMHGVGSSVTNALSKELRVTVSREGHEWSMSFRAGVTHEKLKKGKTTKRTGTAISFLYDDTVMQKNLSFDSQSVARRLRELAYLNPGLTMILRFHGQDEQTFHYPGGLADFVSHEISDRSVEPVHPKPILLRGEVDDEIEKDGEIQQIHSLIEVALQWTTSDRVDVSGHSFVNCINTYEGGTHVKGLHTALRKTLNDVGQELGRFRAKDEAFSREDVREGLIWVLLHNLPNPHYASQVKHTLINPEAEKRIEVFACAKLAEYLLDPKNKAVTDRVLDRVIEARDARVAARKAKAQIAQRKGLLGSSSLPGKLADCQTKNPDEAELFLVEGDSAGGGMKQKRDRLTQAILPLRGKVMNAEKAKDALSSDAINDIVNTLGGVIVPIKVGVKRKGRTIQESRMIVDIPELRYGKVCLAADADVDGGHIVTLLLTFFLRYVPQLLNEGRVYVAELPLYRIEHKKHGRMYLYTDEELQGYLTKNEVKTGADGKNPDVMRFKGLGEMNPGQLKEVALDPETRRLRRVVVNDHADADAMTSLLMGSAVEPRRKYIEEHALEADLDI